MRAFLAAICAVALLAIGGAVGWLLGDDSSSANTVSDSSVDAGFARDMVTHHTQAVTMALMIYDKTTDASVKGIALDIETGQQAERGRFLGWLDGWGLPVTKDGPVMEWMGHSHGPAHMPGMATTTELSKLRASTGKAADVLFLQLMIRHHQSGVLMAEYAADHASVPYVRDAASKIVVSQNTDIVAMEQMLRSLGGTELPPPAD